MKPDPPPAPRPLSDAGKALLHLVRRLNRAAERLVILHDRRAPAPIVDHNLAIMERVAEQLAILLRGTDAKRLADPDAPDPDRGGPAGYAIRSTGQPRYWVADDPPRGYCWTARSGAKTFKTTLEAALYCVEKNLGDGCEVVPVPGR